MTEAAIGWIGLDGPLPGEAVHGRKAAWLGQAAAAGLPVPPGFVLPPGGAEIGAALSRLEQAVGLALDDPDTPLLLALRPSSAIAAGGMTPAILNIGAGPATLPGLAARHGDRTAQDLWRRLVQSYGAAAMGVEGEEFEYALHDALRLSGLESEQDLSAEQLAALADTCLSLIEDEDAGPFPLTGRGQLDGAVAALPHLWSGRRAARRRAALGAETAELALIVQVMAVGLGPAPAGAGFANLRDETTGRIGLSGRFLHDAQGEEALMGLRTPRVLGAAERAEMGQQELSLEETAPDLVADLVDCGRRLEAGLGEAVSLEFTIERDALAILEVKPARRSSRAAIRMAVDLAEAGIISRDEALLRIDPAHLEEQLHPAIDPTVRRQPVGQGLPASPGAAFGPLCFSPDEAEALAARNGAAILALIETSPEDIRGMHAAKGVLTVRGGMTSHAAVVARGLGKPCIVGAKDLMLDQEAGTLTTATGRVFREGEVVTVDGTTGQVMAGEVALVQPEVTGAFATLLGWADEARRMGVRANADTEQDAETALTYGAEGIGLCRTEHMFFQRGRITAMREMILAGSEADRRAALAKLGPMQRDDFVGLFAKMAGRPVTIRLLDPPLHEFLPHGEAELRELAASLDLPVAQVARRADDLTEFNPMLGKRGCRIGIAFPEIYEMQARAIFEAALEAAEATGAPVRPEIMIPLVSAVRELEVLSTTIRQVAEAVRAEKGAMVDYTVGVMIETPRACLRAADIAGAAGFLSFGTNDLTQMLYGLSRDDAGRFMPDYVAQGVYRHDPFHSLDTEGVGEIMELAIARARARMPEISLGLCGEHGGDPASVDFCEGAGLDYVSCSPFRLPVARLAAAQAAIRAR